MLIRRMLTDWQAYRAVFLAFLLISGSFGSPASYAQSAADIVRESLSTFYYGGSDMRAQLTMRLINAQNKTRTREITMLRLNHGEDGHQRYYLYFHSPADIEATAFLVWKDAAREDDRWIFVPAVRLVRRIAADDKRASFVGSDFTYEDISGRDVADESHTLLRSETYANRPVHVIESKPKIVYDYAKRVSWIDSERLLPLKEEYYDSRDELSRIFTADEVENIDGYWTVTKRTMTNNQSRHRTEVIFSNVTYDLGLQPSLFEERSLRNPPRRWVR